MSTLWPGKIVVMMPVFNDWEAARHLLVALDDILYQHRLEARVLFVDDDSTVLAPDDLCPEHFHALQQVEILSLRRNLGNQRAVAVGIAHVQDREDCEVLVIMDGDGEDDPCDVPRLLDEMRRQNERCIVFAARMKRSESWLFLVFYHLYRLLHWLFTGVSVRVGNFSAIPAAHLGRLVLLPEVWNHYAAAVFKSRIPRETIPTHRAPRLAGRSRMNFIGLVAHGLSAISVFGDVVAVRFLLAAGLAMALGGLVAGGLATAALAGAGLPDWSFQAVGLVAVLLSQMLVLGVVFVMMMLGGRSMAGFLLARDFTHFVGNTRIAYQSAWHKEEHRRGKRVSIVRA